jgi:VCBS repeat protein
MAIRKSGSELLANTTTNGLQNASSITGLANGRFVIGWNHDGLFVGDNSIRAQVFNADGSKFSSEFPVHSTPPGSQRNSALEGQIGGNFFAAFDTSFSIAEIKARLFDSAGSPVVNGVTADTNEFQVNTTTTGDQMFPAVAELTGGRIVVAFTSTDNPTTQIRARIFTSNGTPVVNGVTANTNDFIVDSAVAGTQFNASVAELAGGGFVVTYTDAGNTANPVTEARLFDSSGNPMVNGVTGNANSFLVGPADGFDLSASTGLSGGGFVVAWHDPRGMMGRLFDSGGTPVVSPATDATGVFMISSLGFGAITMAPNGGFLATYNANNDIYAQLFDAGAQKVGNQFLVNTKTTGDQIEVAAARLADGRIAISWTDISQIGTTSDFDIRFQVIDPNAPAPPPSNSFNGDAFSDILWQNDNGTAGIWLMNGLSVIADSAVGFNPGPSWKIKAPGDFNGDGSADILWQNDDGTPGIWTMNGLTRMAGANVGFNPGPSWKVIDAADFNGDGRADILWQNDDGTAGIWLMDGFNRLTGANVGFNPGPTWNVKASGDFNGDGKSDILWQNDDGSAGIWLMDGLNRIADGGIGFNPGPTWKVIDAGDYDGDGKADILWQNDNGTPGIWTMDGLTRTGGANVGNSNPGPTWKVKAAGDYNGDGKADILWQNDNGQPAIWLMNGFNVLAESGVGFNPGPTWHVQPDLI